nr:MAG TPA: hypothetical protein [Caudoviricetes sp.]
MSRPRKPAQWALTRARRRLEETARTINADPELAADLTSDQRVIALADEIQQEAVAHWRQQMTGRNTDDRL